jgi:hypothetical protein
MGEEEDINANDIYVKFIFLIILFSEPQTRRSIFQSILFLNEKNIAGFILIPNKSAYNIIRLA